MKKKHAQKHAREEFIYVEQNMLEFLMTEMHV